ncbi:MAG: GNAT family N-acetyltransferase [Oscillospiraceae bacterium]|nr:GNAT family N-acetyltransferase [Oscillospiraceae bacterium]
MTGLEAGSVALSKCAAAGLLSARPIETPRLLLRAVYPFLYERAGLDYIQSGYFVFNEASEALQRKLGMKPWTEAQFEMDGKTIQTREMILFREDWRSAAGKWPENKDSANNSC